MRIMLIAVLCLSLVGCATPKGILDAEDKSALMLENYHKNMDGIIDALIEAYLKAEYGHIDFRMEHDLLLQQDEDGNIPGKKLNPT